MFVFLYLGEMVCFHQVYPIIFIEQCVGDNILMATMQIKQ